MKKRIITVVIVVLALAVAGVGGFILYKNISNQNTEENYKKISESYVAETTGAQDSTVKKRTFLRIRWISLHSASAIPISTAG